MDTRKHLLQLFECCPVQRTVTGGMVRLDWPTWRREVLALSPEQRQHLDNWIGQSLASGNYRRDWDTWVNAMGPPQFNPQDATPLCNAWRHNALGIVRQMLRWAPAEWKLPSLHAPSSMLERAGSPPVDIAMPVRAATHFLSRNATSASVALFDQMLTQGYTVNQSWHLGFTWLHELCLGPSRIWSNGLSKEFVRWADQYPHIASTQRLRRNSLGHGRQEPPRLVCQL